MNYQWLLYLLAGVVVFYLILRLVPYLVVWPRLLGARIRRAEAVLVDAEMIPEAERRILESARESLRALGFEYRHSERLVPMARVADHSLFVAVYFHPTHRAYAAVTPCSLPEVEKPWDVVFSTRCQDGVTRVTQNVPISFLGVAPSWYQTQTIYVATLSQHWEAHRAWVAPRAAQAREYDATESLQRENRFFAEVLALWRQQGWIVPAREPDAYRMRAWPALLRTHQVLRESVKRQAVAFSVDHPIPEDTILLAHTQAHQWQRKAEEGFEQMRSVKAGLFLASGALFLLAFGLLFSWRFAALLLGVLLAHELGHSLAMRAFGYRKLSIFFVPLLGAVATGQKTGAPPWQQFMIYLAGPLPGLLAAFAFFAWFPETRGVWFEVALIALTLNYFNLLPALPLDGGRIVEILFLGRLPWIRLAFAGIGVILLASVAWVLNSFIAAIIAGLVAMTLPTQWRQTRLASRLLRDISPAMTETQRLEKIYFQLLQGRFRQLRHGHRLALAKSLEEWIAVPRPSVSLMVGGGLLYLALLGLPVYYATLPGMPLHSLVANLIPAQAPDWEARLANADTPDARWKLLLEAADWHEYDFDEQGLRKGEPYLRRAMQLARETFATDDERQFAGLKALALLLAEDDEDEAIALKEQALDWLDRHGKPHDLRRAELLEGLFWTQPRALDDAARRNASIQDVKAALAIRRRHGQEDSGSFALALETLASLYERENQYDEAEPLWRQALEIYARHETANEGLRMLATQHLASNLMDQERFPDAEKLLQDTLPQVSESMDYLRADLMELLGWAYWLQQDEPQARRIFEQRLVHQRAFVEKMGIEDAAALFLMPLLDLAHVTWEQQDLPRFQALRRELAAMERASEESGVRYYRGYLYRPASTRLDGWRSWQREAHRAVLAFYLPRKADEKRE